MTNIEFRNILTAAVAGEHYALEIILEQYSPLINRILSLTESLMRI